jgi:hypothetical protein
MLEYHPWYLGSFKTNYNICRNDEILRKSNSQRTKFCEGEIKESF